MIGEVSRLCRAALPRMARPGRLAPLRNNSLSDQDDDVNLALCHGGRRRVHWFVDALWDDFVDSGRLNFVPLRHAERQFARLFTGRHDHAAGRSNRLVDVGCASVPGHRRVWRIYHPVVHDL